MNEEILKLAQKAWGEDHEIFWFSDNGIEDFYRAAFNAGLEAAAKKCEIWDVPTVASKIRALKDKP